MYQLSTRTLSPVHPTLYFPGAPVWPEEYKGKSFMEKLMQNQINNIEKQGIKNGEEIAGLNLRVGKVEQQVSQLTVVVTETNLRVGKLEYQMVTLTDVVTDIGERVGKTEQSIARIDGHLLRIDDHLVRIDKQFEQVDKQFERVDERFDKIDQRFVKIEASMSAMQTMFYELMITQTRWIIGMMLVLVGVTFTAARYIH
ncbi:hypothetical protein J1786_22630 [Rahnella sp. L72c]|uniref:t-SNARE coiled-coil homology domain-containing protein n=2 Tax=Rahnella perminowiae TaxID=2816244 RepID=A0ABS6L7F0_9GAMM|nr:hypothetical protein [Rahnella perminowiae]